MHLGYFPTEEYAARAYDRAAINKGAKEGSGKIVTNYDISEYANELDMLRRITQEELVDALSNEGYFVACRSATDSACCPSPPLVLFPSNKGILMFLIAVCRQSFSKECHTGPAQRNLNTCSTAWN